MLMLNASGPLWPTLVLLSGLPFSNDVRIMCLDVVSTDVDEVVGAEE